MKIKVSDYITQFLITHNILDVFTVVGGGAMHLNDSLGHAQEIHCLYHHHEQAAAMACEAYFRIHGRMAALCVTSGPGALNALNGVVGAYQDSIPMLIFSGQTKTNLTIFQSGLHLRSLGNQEFDIIGSLRHMVKYGEMIMDARKIQYCLEKAYILAQQGRPGPCWLDIPLDIQGAYVETSELKGYIGETEDYLACEIYEEYTDLPKGNEIQQDIEKIILKLNTAQRPVLYAGNGIRIAGAANQLKEMARCLQLPVVTCWDSIDLMESDDPLYVGRGGTMGDRAGNFAVQNSDFLLCIGSRLNVYQVGYDVKTWAREAYVIVNDIDPEELKKPTVRIDMGVCCDAGFFMQQLVQAYQESGILNAAHEKWISQCALWKSKYPVVMAKHYDQKQNVNVYAFMDALSRILPDDAITVVANGSASVVGSQTYYIGKGSRFLMNCGVSSMGYGLPAAIGACIANGRKGIICIEGDGSIMMNLQELQTVVTNQLPIKIFILNNNGYHQIRLTQNNIFGNKLVGVGPESGDLSFPDYERIADAFRLSYFRIQTMEGMKEKLQQVLSLEEALICEIMCDTEQIFEPKSSAKRLEDGSLISPPLEDLAPFLPRNELEENMYIDIISS